MVFYLDEKKCACYDRIQEHKCKKQNRKGAPAMTLRKDAETIIHAAIASALPDQAVERALSGFRLPETLFLVSVGKAGWQMASAASRILGRRIQKGIVITKYGHSKGPLSRMEIFEAGHPVPDENSIRAAEAARDLAASLKEGDALLFLLSGGGSALFELPLLPLSELMDITGQLLACGADITEINTIRKRLSAVKGGRFARLCAPARVYSVILSDILGDPLDMIASGPTAPDTSTCAQALEIVKKYRLKLSEKALSLLEQETEHFLGNAENQVTGSVRQLCRAAASAAQELGYRPFLLTDSLCCTARDAGSFLSSIARSHQDTEESLAFLAGGETIVRLTGSGLGGRSQELALAACPGLSGLSNTCVFSFGSDGTDGPTDAAGGYVDQDTLASLQAQGISAAAFLQNNDAYHALQKCGGLIMTGPTGTNVNDLSVLLIKRP